MLGTIGLKPSKTKGVSFDKITGKEKALILLMADKKTNWEGIKVLYEINDETKDKDENMLKNLRTTFSKVKTKHIDDDKHVNKDKLKRINEADADSISRCLLYIIE